MLNNSTIILALIPKTTRLRKRAKCLLFTRYIFVLIYFVVFTLLFSLILSDLPSQLEGAWNWIEASGDAEALEQITVTLRTALRLSLPFSHHFLCTLRQKGVIVDNMDTLVTTQNVHRPHQPWRRQRGCACQWRGNISRQYNGMERNKIIGGAAKCFRNFRERGNMVRLLSEGN